MRFGKHRLQLLAAHSRFLGPARSQTASAHTIITPTHTPTSGTDTWATHTYTTEPTRFDSVGERLRVNMCVCLFLCVCDRERESASARVKSACRRFCKATTLCLGFGIGCSATHANTSRQQAGCLFVFARVALRQKRAPF